MDLISIITPSYKSKDFIHKTIKSVINQTYTNWEMIIVDDCSPDDSNNIINDYILKDSRIKLIKLKKNAGPALARNKAINVAKGKFIAFLDSDDLWSNEKLEIQIDFMTKNNYLFTYHSYCLIDKNDKLLNKIIIPPLKLSYEDLLKSNHIGCLTAIYNCHELGKIYMPEISKRQDYGLWLTIIKKTKFAYGMEEALGQYRILENSVSSKKIDLIKYHYTLFTHFEKINKVKALYYICWNILTKFIYR